MFIELMLITYLIIQFYEQKYRFFNVVLTMVIYFDKEIV